MGVAQSGHTWNILLALIENGLEQARTSNRRVPVALIGMKFENQTRDRMGLEVHVRDWSPYSVLLIEITPFYLQED